MSVSKYEFDRVRHLIGCELLHPQNNSCLKSIFHTLVFSLAGCSAFYFQVYLVS